MRRFTLISTDAVLADGVLFPNGKCSLSWRGPNASMTILDSIKAVERDIEKDADIRIEFFDSVPSRQANMKLSDLTKET